MGSTALFLTRHSRSAPAYRHKTNGKTAAGEQQHPCVQLAEQPPGQLGLVHRQRPSAAAKIA